MKRRTASTLKRSLILFGVGAVFGSLGDFFHYTSGTDGYPTYHRRIPVMDLPLWVPLLFGSAALAIGLSHPSVDRALGRKSITERYTWRQLLAGSVAFMALYAASGFLPLATGGGKDAVIAIMALAIWFAFDRSWQGALVGMITAGIGVGVEEVLIRNGVFFYLPKVANLYSLPSWLPWLYLAASIVVGNFGRALSEDTAKAK